MNRRFYLALFCCLLAAWGAQVVADEPGSSVVDASVADDGANAPPRRLTARQRAAERRAQREAERLAKEQEEHEKWLARLEARGVEPWPDLSAEDHAAALKRSREMVDDILGLLPGTALYETEHFLFVSNIPPEQVAPYVRYLDRMYDWMCNLYGVPEGKTVWLGGKAPIFAFLHEAEFKAFENRYFDVKPVGMYGLCHQNSRGDVVISCFRGDDPNDFGQMLVHETSHGFIHRYKTKARLPSWVNEGMADLIGAEMVPQSKTVANRERLMLLRLKQEPSLGGDFFTAEPIDAWQYGIASSMNRFLLQADRRRYVRFIEAMKEGMPWNEALEQAYGGTPAQLLEQYGQAIGVPDLRP